uniref:Uncharacterized protein n=1 Tax=Aotus nancymaae TaxID=37293 RepID=A0A2K5CKG1_AOTNA
MEGPILPKTKSNPGVTELANRLICGVFLLHMNVVLLVLLPGPPQGYQKVKSSPEQMTSSSLLKGPVSAARERRLQAPAVPLCFSECITVQELANGTFIRVALTEKDRCGMPTR